MPEFSNEIAETEPHVISLDEFTLDPKIGDTLEIPSDHSDFTCQKYTITSFDIEGVLNVSTGKFTDYKVVRYSYSWQGKTVQYKHNFDWFFTKIREWYSNDKDIKCFRIN